MNFFKRATSLLKTNKGQSAGEQTVNTLKKLALRNIGVTLLLPGFFFILVFAVIALTLLSSFGYKLDVMQLVDPYNSVSIGVDLNYDLEEYYDLSNAATESSGNPSSDFRGTDVGSVSAFNQHIIDSVEAAGYGTRQGVVAAGMALVGDYIKYTGHRVMYDQSTRQATSTSGIVDENYLALDCSGFVFWSLYNGGFYVPDDLAVVQTDYIYAWSNSRGYSSAIKGGQPGDFLVTMGKGHIILIVGTYASGYWCLEEMGWGVGAEVTKREYSDLSSYVRIDMTNYYNDSSNVRDK